MADGVAAQARQAGDPAGRWRCELTAWQAARAGGQGREAGRRQACWARRESSGETEPMAAWCRGGARAGRLRDTSAGVESGAQHRQDRSGVGRSDREHIHWAADHAPDGRPGQSRRHIPSRRRTARSWPAPAGSGAALGNSAVHPATWSGDCRSGWQFGPVRGLAAGRPVRRVRSNFADRRAAAIRRPARRAMFLAAVGNGRAWAHRADRRHMRGPLGAPIADPIHRLRRAAHDGSSFRLGQLARQCHRCGNDLAVG